MAHITQTMAMTHGTLREATLFNPMQQSGKNLPGLALMVRCDNTHGVHGFDPPLWRGLHIGGVNVMSIALVGDQGCGKTLTGNVMCDRAPLFNTGIPGVSGRVAYDSLKYNNGEKPETLELSKFLNGERESTADYVYPIRLASFDPLQMHEGMQVYYGSDEKAYEEGKAKGLYHIRAEEVFDEIFQMLTDIFETAGSGINDAEHEVMSYILEGLVPNEKRSIKMFRSRLMHYNFKKYQQVMNVQNGVPEEESILGHFKRTYEQAAHTLLLRVQRLARGSTGRLFGSEEGNTLLKHMESPMVSFDFKGCNDQTNTLAHLILWKLRASALLHNYRPRITFMNVHDEIYEKWRIPSFARAMYTSMKTLRERGAIEVSMFHRLKDLESVGTAGSEHARYAENSLNEIAIWFIGRLPRSEWPRLRERFGFNQEILDTLPTLATGCFWLVVGNRPPELVYVVPTYEELMMFNTDAAGDSLLMQYYATKDPLLYLKYLESLPFDPPKEDTDEKIEPALV